MELSRVRCLSFDCYGTLVDWETGILDALRPVFSRHGVGVDNDEVLRGFAEAEAVAETGPFRRYREVLRDVLLALGSRFGFVPDEAELAAFPASVGAWPPFSDSAPALRELGARYRLIVLSNVDEDLFANTERALGVRFDAVFTAERIGAYKPSPRNFDFLIEHAGVERDEILHCAQSLYHDIAPARRAGLATVWVNRQTGRQGSATPVAEATPDATVGSLSELIELLGR